MPRLDRLCQRLAELAPALDAPDAWPAEQLALCGEAGVFAWFVAPQLGGQGWSEVDLLRGYIKLAAACLTTTFVITQRMGAVGRIAAGDSLWAREQLLPGLIGGRKVVPSLREGLQQSHVQTRAEAARQTTSLPLSAPTESGAYVEKPLTPNPSPARGEGSRPQPFATVGISHLTTSRQHLARPVLRAEETASGLVLDGYSPWVTGAEFAQHIVLGATLADDRQVLVALPTELPGVRIERSPPLVGLSASRTGPVHLDRVLVNRRWLLAGPVAEVMKQGAGAKTGGLQTSALALGLASAAIGYLQDERRGRTNLDVAASACKPSGTSWKPTCWAWPAGIQVCTNDAIRSRANSLALRASQAALAAAKGAGYVAGASRRPLVPRSVVFPGLELPANRARRQLVRAGGDRGVKSWILTHVVWHEHTVTRADREQLSGHQGCVVWFTGLSGCGKSTVANVVDRQLYERGLRSFLLDGDNVRHGLNASPAMLAAYGETLPNGLAWASRPKTAQENIRRIGAVAELFASAGIITLTAFVSPYRADRDAVRKQVEARGRPGDFVEVFVDAPLEVCEARDPKGLYKKARAGELKDFTGIDAPYEAPLAPDLRLESAQQAPDVLSSAGARTPAKNGQDSLKIGRIAYGSR